MTQDYLKIGETVEQASGDHAEEGEPGVEVPADRPGGQQSVERSPKPP